MKILPLLTVAIALTAVLTAPAPAQTAAEATDTTDGVHSSIGFGVRTGYTGWNGINQIHFGAHLKVGELFPNVQFTPNIEAGFGDGATIITLNGDLAYSFTEFVERPWHLYGGGSLSFNYVKPDDIDSETDLGFSVLIGLERTFANEHQGLIEIRIGVMDSPDFKLTFGYTLF